MLPESISCAEQNAILLFSFLFFLSLPFLFVSSSSFVLLYSLNVNTRIRTLDADTESKRLPRGFPSSLYEQIHMHAHTLCVRVKKVSSVLAALQWWNHLPNLNTNKSKRMYEWVYSDQFLWMNERSDAEQIEQAIFCVLFQIAQNHVLLFGLRTFIRFIPIFIQFYFRYLCCSIHLHRNLKLGHCIYISLLHGRENSNTCNWIDFNRLITIHI